MCMILNYKFNKSFLNIPCLVYLPEVGLQHMVFSVNVNLQVNKAVVILN